MRSSRFWLLCVSLIVLVLTEHSNAQIFAWRRNLAANTLTVGVNPRNPHSVYAQGSNGYILVSYDKGATWSQRGNPGISQVRQILVHPSDTTIILTVAFSGGLRRSTDYGLTWSIVLPSFGIDGESISYDHAHPDTMYAGNYSDANVYRSTDRGATWLLVSSAGSTMCTIEVRPDSSNILYAGTGNGKISKSTDYGATWKLVKGSGSFEIPKIVIDPLNPMIAYGAAYAGADSTVGVWKTTNGGENWNLTTLTGVSIWSLDISSSNPDVLYAGTFNDPHDAVYRTTDAGITWDSIKTGFPSGGNAWSLKVDPSDSENAWLAIGGSNRTGIYRRVPLRARVEGTILDSLTGTPAVVGSITLLSTGERIELDGTGFYVFDYFEGDSLLTPFAHIEAYPYYKRDEQLTFIPDSVITHNIRMRRLKTAAITGTVKTLVGQLPLQAYVELYGNTFGHPGILASISTNTSGEFQISSQYISYPPIVQYDSLYVNPVFPFAQKVFKQLQLDSSGFSSQIFLDTADVLVVSTTWINSFLGYNRFQGFYREALDSIGLTSHVWFRLGRGYAPARRALQMRKKTAIYYTGSDSLLLSEDRDSLVTGINAGINVFVTGQNFVERNDSLSRQYFGIHHGGNTNQTFVKGTNDLFGNSTYGTNAGTGANNQTSRDILLLDNPRLRPVLEYGFGGGAGIAGVRLDSIRSGGKLVLLGFGFEAINSAVARKTIMGQVIGYLSGTIVLGVDDRKGNSPVQFSLEQNYPNPFNPSTTIQFSIPEKNKVALQIFDILGRTVSVLVDEELNPGAYSKQWNAGQFASGVYVCRLSAGRFSSSKKLLLLR